MHLFECLSVCLLISTDTCTYTWRAAHLANRPHYMGGWTIDPIVTELKKSPFSFLSSNVCDIMSWSYLAAPCTMTDNLTLSSETLWITKMSALKLNVRSFEWEGRFLACFVFPRKTIKMWLFKSSITPKARKNNVYMLIY